MWTNVHIYTLPPFSLSHVSLALPVSCKLRGLRFCVCVCVCVCPQMRKTSKRRGVQSKLAFGWKPVILFHPAMLPSSSPSLSLSLLSSRSTHPAVFSCHPSVPSNCTDSHILEEVGAIYIGFFLYKMTPIPIQGHHSLPSRLKTVAGS